MEQKISICEEADRLVTVERQESYDSPLKNFTITAEMLTSAGFTFHDNPIEAADVGLIMLIVKIARQSFKHKHDTLVDICGYAKCIDMVHEEGAALLCRTC